MSSVVLLLALVFLIVSGCTCDCSKNAIPKEELRSKIMDTRNIIDKVAINNGEFEEVESYFAKDIIVMDQNRKMVTGIDAYRKRANALKESGFKIMDIKREIVDTWSCGDKIYEIGTAEIKIIIPPRPPFPDPIPDPIPKPDPTSYMSIWETKADGQLLLKFIIWNTDTKMVD